ncbi:MAG: hypothetical protein LBF85_07865 [Tannerella sp.]|jgi:hypothetical protein|nr:hypothetical protein [Tannerella sp.]
MKRKTDIPRSMTSFTDYMSIAYNTAEENITVYGINPDELAKIKPLFDEFMVQESLCVNPYTATKSNRDARFVARAKLEKQWRVFLNREIRLNDAISIAEKEIFGIFPHDSARTPVSSPKSTGKVNVVRTGACQFDVIVGDTATGKRKRPADAAGSNLYLAVTEVNEPEPHRESYRFAGFSSRCRHTVVFSSAHFVKRAWLYVRYTSRRGQEGPEGPVASFIVN